MSEPNFAVARNGQTMMLRVVVSDDHWKDKNLYKVMIPTQDGYIEKYVRARDLYEEDQP